MLILLFYCDLCPYLTPAAWTFDAVGLNVGPLKPMSAARTFNNTYVILFRHSYSPMTCNKSVLRLTAGKSARRAAASAAVAAQVVMPANNAAASTLGLNIHSLIDVPLSVRSASIRSYAPLGILGRSF